MCDRRQLAAELARDAERARPAKQGVNDFTPDEPRNGPRRQATSSDDEVEDVRMGRYGRQRRGAVQKSHVQGVGTASGLPDDD